MNHILTHCPLETGVNGSPRKNSHKFCYINNEICYCAGIIIMLLIG